MKDLYKKIDDIFSGYDDDRPMWAQELLQELKEIKQLVQKINKTKKEIDTGYYDFIKTFRQSMQANTEEGIYPKVRYASKKIGVDFNGYLYDLNSSKTLSRDEAFKVYKYLYENKNNLHIYK